MSAVCANDVLSLAVMIESNLVALCTGVLQNIQTCNNQQHQQQQEQQQTQDAASATTPSSSSAASTPSAIYDENSTITTPTSLVEHAFVPPIDLDVDALLT
jgi:hypothetical protein